MTMKRVTKSSFTARVRPMITLPDQPACRWILGQRVDSPVQDNTEFQDGNTDELSSSLGLGRHDADIVIAAFGLDIGVSLLLALPWVERGLLRGGAGLNIKRRIEVVVVSVSVLGSLVM